MTDQGIAQLAINTIRTLSIDAVQKADSGHPGLPLGAAPMAYQLWQHHLRFAPAEPHWPDRDRFVLSAGHGSMLLYSLLHLYGYDLSMEELQAFRQWGSRTPGHPEWHLTPGVEATTGPLGQGTANAVGMAIAERALAHRFNRPGHTLVDHRTFALVSDGDLMEGVSGEAASLAGHMRLGKLTYLYDANDITLDGPASLAFSREDVLRRYEAYGWHVQRVDDGNHDLAAIDAAIAAAVANTEQPSIILVHTTIGFGSPHKAGTSEAHGSPLGPDEVALTKKALGWDPERSFYVPDEARAHMAEAGARGDALRRDWEERLAAYGRDFPDLALEWKRRLARELPPGWDAELPAFKAGDSIATRVAGGKVMGAIAARVPWLMGGDADLSVSTKTSLKDGGSFDAQSGAGRNMHFGVREHAMGSIANGMDYHGGVRAFVSTFFCFSDYMRPAVRLAALNGQPILYVWTHDSIALGEDGPTHQPVEHLAALRAMPNLAMVRPGDANETTEAWRWAMTQTKRPVGLVLSRQNLPVIDRQRFAPASGLARGAYVLAEAVGGAPLALLIATGAEVHLALAAYEKLAAEGIPVRVVSMPCWELFAEQSEEYRAGVLPAAIKARIAIEAGVSFGWREWVGDHGVVVGIDHYGASAPAQVNFEKFGFTPDRVVQAVRAAIDRGRSS